MSSNENESARNLRQHIELGRLLFNRKYIAARLSSRSAEIPLATQLNYLREPECRLSRIQPAIFATAEDILQLHRRFGGGSLTGTSDPRVLGLQVKSEAA